MGEGAQIRAGRAFVEIGGNDAPLINTLRSVEHQMSGFASSLQALTLYELGEKILGPITEQFTALGTEMLKASLKTGMTVEEISALGYAAQVSGVGLESLEMGIAKMSRGIAKAASGSPEAVAALNRLGLSVDSLSNLSQTERFTSFARAIAGIQDPTMRAAAAISIFGRGGYNLLPFLSKGSAGIKDLTTEAERFGMIISAEAAEAAHELEARMIALHASLKMTVFALGTELQPLLLEGVEWIRVNVISTAEWIKGHKDLIITTGELAAGFLILVRALAILETQAKRTNLALALIGYLVFSMTDGFGLLGESAEYAAQKAAKVREEGDKQRATDLDLIERLKELNAQERLSAGQKQETSNIIATLTGRYGELGLGIDGVTGKLTGLAEAQQRVNAAMEKQAFLQARAALSTAEAAIQEAIEPPAGIQHMMLEVEAAPGILGFGKGATWDEFIRERRAKVMRGPLGDTLRAAQHRMEMSMMGDLTGGAAGRPRPGLPSQSDPVKLAHEISKIDREISKAKIAMIEDEEQRKLAQLRLAYDEEIRTISELAMSSEAELSQIF